MASTAPRERRRVALREAILEAARGLLRSEGLRALTMRRIAEAVDYAPASLYSHFGSREALLAELCRAGMAGLRAALERAVAGIDDPYARLAAAGRAYLQFALDEPDVYRLMFMEDAAITKAVFEHVEWEDGAAALAIVAAPFVQLRAAGAPLPADDPARLTDLFFAAVHGVASLRLACPSIPATDDAALIATAVDAIAGRAVRASGRAAASA
ncbi:MAG TPA: helix-turn-helix domain-containing protein [Candidatus Sulfotelmatobacter sp.]|nr:helix-turn-helix domain-containing protein [Candidatus Sulfotelmatobacter sp.]